MARKIYLASSWKNKSWVRSTAFALKLEGHEVFAFIDPAIRPRHLEHFCFDAANWEHEPLNEIDMMKFMEYPETQRAFRVDRSGLDWCDTVILMLPCGRSAHLEAGYAVGAGKELIILGPRIKGEYETMYGFASKIFATDGEFSDPLFDYLRGCD